MITVKHLNRMGILLALVLIILGVYPLILNVSLTNDVLATSIIFILVGIGYIITVFKSEWNKAVLFFEGIVFAISGGLLLSYPYNILFVILGIVVFIISILAYIRKLPKFLLKFFYR